VRITDSSRTSREVRKVPKSGSGRTHSLTAYSDGGFDLGCGLKQGYRNDERCTCANEKRERSNDGNAGSVDDVMSDTSGDIDLGRQYGSSGADLDNCCHEHEWRENSQVFDSVEMSSPSPVDPRRIGWVTRPRGADCRHHAVGCHSGQNIRHPHQCGGGCNNRERIEFRRILHRQSPS
jgi:hypothetical protein